MALDLEAVDEQGLVRGPVLVGQHAGGDDRQAVAGLFEQRRDLGRGVEPGQLGFRRRQPQHLAQARRVEVAEAVAALVAHPMPVDVHVHAGLEPRHALAVVVPRAVRVRVHRDVAAARAVRADRLGLLEVPDADLVAEVAVGQRADGADVDDVAGVGVVERHAGRQVDPLRVAHAENAELVGLRDVVDEARAARAQDAALLVEHDVGTDLDALLLVLLVLAHRARVLPDLHVVVLKTALAALIADRAVERVVHEVELERARLRALDGVGVGLDLEALAHAGAAGDLRLGRAGHLDDAHAAVAGVAERRVVTVVRNLDAGVLRRLDDELALGGLALHAVELVLDDLTHG
ncbi:MAG: hypothetical protein M0D55_05990 [Elusimicrobiota bacterium]|nr:MAG: hypothetical protein M0D55_05990 [Elusimicrobiota bacterium]